MTDPDLGPPSAAQPPPDGSAPGGREGAPPWGVLEAIAVFVVTLGASFVIAGTVLAVSAIVLDAQVAELISQNVAQLVMLGGVLIWVLARYGRPALGWVAGSAWARGAGVGVGVGVVSFLVINLGLSSLIGELVSQVGGELPPTQEGLRQAAADPAVRVPFLLAVVIMAPLAEEVFFRGMLLSALVAKVGRWPAIILSALAFGLVHVQGGLAAYLFLIALTFPLGVVLAWLALRTRSLAAPIAGHAVFNACTAALISGAAPA